VRALSRRPAALGQWIPFDWDNQRSWPLAFAGSVAAYILIPFNHPGAPERTPDLIVEPRPGRGRDRLASLRHRAREDPPSWTQKAHTGRASACVCRIGRADRLRLTPPDELRSWVLMRRAGHVDCADLIRPKSLSGKAIRQNVGTILRSAQRRLCTRRVDPPASTAVIMRRVIAACAGACALESAWQRNA
jgi:hypothetical protein